LKKCGGPTAPQERGRETHARKSGKKDEKSQQKGRFIAFVAQAAAPI